MSKIKYIETIVLNVISDIVYFLLSSLLAILPMIVTKHISILNLFFLCVVIGVCLLIFLKYHKNIYHLKWGFFIKENTYTLKLNEDNRTAVFKSIIKGDMNLGGDRRILGSYCWPDVEKILNAKVISNLTGWKLHYKSSYNYKNEYTLLNNDNGEKEILIDDKCVDYIIEYNDDNCNRDNKFNNEVIVDFEYKRSTFEREFYAGIKYPTRKLNIILYADRSVVTNVCAYAKTFLGTEYNIIEKHTLRRETDQNGTPYYIWKVKPKLFCKYVITWDWA